MIVGNFKSTNTILVNLIFFLTFQTEISEETKQDGNFCTECDKAFKPKSSFKRHAQLHTGNMWLCDFSSACTKQFFTEYDLKMHKKMKHSPFVLVCEICSKSFKSKLGLNNHIRRHQHQFKYLCGKDFNYKNDLDQHLANHEAKKYIIVRNVKKKCSSKRNVKRHLETCQIRESKYACDLCEKRFKSKRYLKAHLAGHNNPEGHQCSTCGEVFKYRASLYKHAKKTGHK